MSWRVKRKFKHFIKSLSYICVTPGAKHTGHRELRLQHPLYRTYNEVHFTDSVSVNAVNAWCLVAQDQCTLTGDKGALPRLWCATLSWWCSPCMGHRLCIVASALNGGAMLEKCPVYDSPCSTTRCLLHKRHRTWTPCKRSKSSKASREGCIRVRGWLAWCPLQPDVPVGLCEEKGATLMYLMPLLWIGDLAFCSIGTLHDPHPAVMHHHRRASGGEFCLQHCILRGTSVLHTPPQRRLQFRSSCLGRWVTVRHVA